MSDNNWCLKGMFLAEILKKPSGKGKGYGHGHHEGYGYGLKQRLAYNYPNSEPESKFTDDFYNYYPQNEGLLL